MKTTRPYYAFTVPKGMILVKIQNGRRSGHFGSAIPKNEKSVGLYFHGLWYQLVKFGDHRTSPFRENVVYRLTT